MMNVLAAKMRTTMTILDLATTCIGCTMQFAFDTGPRKWFAYNGVTCKRVIFAEQTFDRKQHSSLRTNTSQRYLATFHVN